ncbi:hypothetical protein SUGI_1480440 [Cryptomeria japonica]|uniref:Uncharacterized protein n=1 Tax=Cryptomeria japonica TaxID=3369 RepID=A0AAD3RRP2_CRYJA|nr:hypothetical protein SUGI_1478110 [Cryptomeria japonica]GLJ58853.1 hypothetical protein SUGI_1480440 [Cryptomeria japonica]
MQLISVQLAIDLYMGLGQGKRRAVELNLRLEDIKRGWSSTLHAGVGVKGHKLDLVLALTPLNLHLERLNRIVRRLPETPDSASQTGRDALRGSGSGYAAVSDIGSYTMHLPTPTRIAVMVNR